MDELTDTEWHLANELYSREGLRDWKHCEQAAKMAFVLRKARFNSDTNPFFIDWRGVMIFAGLDGVDRDTLADKMLVIEALAFIEAHDSFDPNEVVVSTN